MINQAKISVIIPVYNKEKYLKKTIQSVLNQDFTNFELIIIDDGSTDDSVSIVSGCNDKRVRFFKQKNQGVSVARNQGVKFAKTELIAFLDADDLWLPTHLSEIYTLYNHFSKAVFFATAYQIKFNKKLSKSYIYPFQENRILLNKYYQYSVGIHLFYTSNFAVKKSIFNELGGFKENIHAEDTDFFLRIGLQYPMAYSKKITLIHLNDTENSLFEAYSIDKKAMLTERFKDVEKNDLFLKSFLDANRFAWAIEYKLANNKEKANNLIKEIGFSNLNNKQKLLLKLPVFVLKYLKKLQKYLKKQGYYSSVFSRS